MEFDGIYKDKFLEAFAFRLRYNKIVEFINVGIMDGM